MAWLLIGCTILIIVCLGGGKTLGKIVLWVIGLAVAAVVLLFLRTNTDLPAPTAMEVMVPILLVAGFFWLFGAAVRLERRIKEGKAGSFWRWL